MVISAGGPLGIKKKGMHRLHVSSISDAGEKRMTDFLLGTLACNREFRKDGKRIFVMLYRWHRQRRFAYNEECSQNVPKIERTQKLICRL